MSESTAAQRRADFVKNVLHGESRGIAAMLLRGLLTPPSYLYRAGLEAYLTPFRVGMRQRYRLRDARGLRVPTVAIGNLSSGGTGKTPMAQAVATGLQKAGNRVVILSRGHGGSADGSRPRIVGDGFRTLLNAKKAGDEPVLLSDSLPGVPVVIGKDRRLSGDLAIERFGPDIVLLDDALQYWQLHRDLDIVLLDARRPFDNGFLLPRGLLREPPSHLSRAGIVVLTRADRVPADELERTLTRVRRLARQAEVFTATHAPTGWVAANDRATLLPLNALAGHCVAVFSGIADNDSFRESVQALGATVAWARAFPDHHPFERAEVTAMAAEIGDAAEIVVTTEKDLVKAGSRWPPAAPPLLALRIGMKIDDEKRFMDVVLGVVSRVR